MCGGFVRRSGAGVAPAGPGLPRRLVENVSDARWLPRHNTVTINGARVRFFRTYPGCPTIGGDELITLVMGKPRGVQFAACLRGPGLAPLERKLFAMLRSTTFDAKAIPTG